MSVSNEQAFVSLKDVDIIYGDDASSVKALEGTNLHVEKGSFIAVVGPSGCGKSSLMRLVTGLIPPSAGTVKVADKLVNGPLKIAGMAFQNPTLLPWRNTLDNVMLPLEIVEGYRKDLGRNRSKYQEKAYAAGKIPGGFFKREGRPSEGETLTARLIDRPIRPLFPKGCSRSIKTTSRLLPRSFQYWNPSSRSKVSQPNFSIA